MLTLLIYIALSLVLFIFCAFIFSTFLKYQYRGDKVRFFLILFCCLYIVIFVFNLTLMRSGFGSGVDEDNQEDVVYE